MRLDKWLKLSRLVKRRTIAKELCDANRVQLDGKVAGASTEVVVAQVVTIRFGNRQLQAKIERIPERDNVSIQEAPSLYTLISARTFAPIGGGPDGGHDGPFVA